MTDGDGNSQITLVGSFQKNDQEAVCAGVNPWQGKDYFFVRIFVPVIGTNNLIPTPKGINLPYDRMEEFFDGIKKLGEIMGGAQTVKTMSKGKNSEIRFCSSTFKGQSLLDIREFIIPKDDSKPFATKKGLSIRTEQFPLLFEIVEKLNAFVAVELGKNN